MAIMASSHCVCVSDHASIAWPVIQFWGSWLGTVKRERREADRKLVAGCYLCDRGRNVNPDSGIIRRRPLHWVIVALVEQDGDDRDEQDEQASDQHRHQERKIGLKERPGRGPKMRYLFFGRARGLAGKATCGEAGATPLESRL